MTSAPRAGGDGLQRAVRVMDVLRSPGGCPWDAEQTHASLARYLVEECYEVLEAIESDDRTLLREELGDLLLQVLFHARLAEELPPDEAFGIDEVAGDLADKLVRRHPHVFAGDESAPAVRPAQPADGAALDEAWEARKILEKGRTSALDGVPIAQPALALTAKLVSRTRRAGLDVRADSARAGSGDESPEEQIGRRLFALVDEAVDAGVDPESALRRVASDYRRAVRDAETRPVARGGLPDGFDQPNSR